MNSRRALFAALFFSLAAVLGAAQEDQNPTVPKPKFPDENEEPRLPDGKSQKNAIAKEQHEQVLKDADQLVAAAEELRKQIQTAGSYVLPIGSVKKTEEIEKLAKRIRGRLKS